MATNWEEQAELRQNWEASIIIFRDHFDFAKKGDVEAIKECYGCIEEFHRIIRDGFNPSRQQLLEALWCCKDTKYIVFRGR